MSEFRTGAGGYGGISTMNQDQRAGKYDPHRVVSVLKNFLFDQIHIRCHICGQEWIHPRGTPTCPPICKSEASDERN